MKNYLSRQIEPVLTEYLKAFPVVGITGPRQSGKSTLLQHALPDYRYVTFDDPRIYAFLHEDPMGFIQQHHDQVIFDEVQKAPELLSLIKYVVDQDRDRYGRFVLTGSSQLMLLDRVSESLAGRIGLLSLLPFQLTEIPEPMQEASVFFGGYPELVLRSYAQSSAWYASYVDTYVNRDVRLISQIGDLRDFERFVHLLASNISQLLNMSFYARDLGVSVPTIKRWVSVLEASYLIFLLPPYFENMGKRITKAPKVYFYDTGLVSYLVGIQTKEHAWQGPMAGSLFENYVVSEVVKRETHANTHADFFYWRTTQGMEIDLIVDRKNSQELIEIKSGATCKPSMFKALKAYRKPQQTGTLIYRGERFDYAEGLKALHYRDYLSTA